MASAKLKRPEFARPGYRNAKYRSVTPRSPVWKIIGILLAGLVVVVIGAVLFLHKPPATTSALAYAAPIGKRVRATLRDGSTVLLAPGSKLRIAPGYGTRGRHVFLDGEGYFDVMRDPANPFTVHTGSVTTRVLGTRFDLRAFRGENHVRVAVLQGTVAFDDTAILRAGTVAQRDATGHVTRLPNADPASLITWGKGILTFNHISLAEAIPQLKRWYGLNIYLANNKLAQRKLSADFRDTMSPTAVIDSLAKQLGVHVERHGSDVLLRG